MPSFSPPRAHTSWAWEGDRSTPLGQAEKRGRSAIRLKMRYVPLPGTRVVMLKEVGMREETRALLRDMGDWPWFERVGEPIDDPGVIAVSSWEEALEPRRSYVWECLRLQVRNLIFNVVNQRDWHRAQRWNPITDEVKRALKPLFARVQTLGSRLSLSEK